MFRSAFLALIRFYRKGISPWTPPSCRFTPTCSAYAQEAIERFGAWRGGWMAVKRILRCHPFGGHGWDPVPSHGVGGGKEGGEDDPSERPSPAPISESERKTGTDEA